MESVMKKARDVMTSPVIAVPPTASVREATRIMLQNKISGLPVVGTSGGLVGMVTEGDFLRRVETGTIRRRPRWIELLMGPGPLAEEYVQAASGRVEDVMTREVRAASEDASLEDIVRLMEHHRIKRVPVLRDRQLVGIVTRANLLRALVHAVTHAPQVSSTDASIRERLLSELKRQPWAPVDGIDVAVADGIVTLSGVLTDDRQRQAICVAAENVAGVKKVEDRLVWVVLGGSGGPPLVIGPATER
jgi:CBS domain-containing protein